MLSPITFSLFSDPTARIVILGCGVLGACAGALGCFAILRRRALVSDAVAHAALPGVCVSYLIFGERNLPALILGAFVFGLLAAGSIALVQRYSRIKDDAATALAIGGFFGLGIVLSRIIQNSPTGNRAGLDGFIFGKAASLVWSDVVSISILAICILGTLALFFKEFSAVCFDRGFCASLGWSVLLYELLLVVLVTACAVVALPATGAVLIVALLIIPGITARFWTDSLLRMVLLGGLIGFSSAVLGTIVSATVPPPGSDGRGGWPTGPMITLVASALFFLSLFFSPRRGVVADWIRTRRMRKLLAKQLPEVL